MYLQRKDGIIMSELKIIKTFKEIIEYFPIEIKDVMSKIPKEIIFMAQEIRLRVNKPIMINCSQLMNILNLKEYLHILELLHGLEIKIKLFQLHFLNLKHDWMLHLKHSSFFDNVIKNTNYLVNGNLFFLQLPF